MAKWQFVFLVTLLCVSSSRLYADSIRNQTPYMARDVLRATVTARVIIDIVVATFIGTLVSAVFS